MASFDEVKLESERFYKALPTLILKYHHRWVVFRGGELVSDHATEEQAFKEALQRFGAEGGFVVAPVEDVNATPITAGVMFGHAWNTTVS